MIERKEKERGQNGNGPNTDQKETGEPQILESYSIECEDPLEECDTDIVTVYAMPDGTTQRTQNHTW